MRFPMPSFFPLRVIPSGVEGLFLFLFLLLFPFLFLLSSCSKQAEQETPSDPLPDQGTPEGVVSYVLQAARTGHTAHLDLLCAPQGRVEADARRICELTDSTAWSSGFMHSFADMEMLNSCGEEATWVVALQTSDGTGRCLEAALVQVGERWYLDAVR